MLAYVGVRPQNEADTGSTLFTQERGMLMELICVLVDMDVDSPRVKATLGCMFLL